MTARDRLQRPPNLALKLRADREIKVDTKYDGSTTGIIHDLTGNVSDGRRQRGGVVR